MGALPVMNSSGWLYCNRSSHPGCVEDLNRILRHFRATYNETDTRVNTVTFSHCKGVRSHSIGTQSYNKKSTRTLTLIMRVTAVTVSTHTHRNTCKQSKINMFGFWCLLVQMVSCWNRTCVRAHTDKNKNLLKQALVCSLIQRVHVFSDTRMHTETNCKPRLKSCPHKCTFPWPFCIIDESPSICSSSPSSSSFHPSIITYLSAALSLIARSRLSALSCLHPLVSSSSSSSS